MKMVKCSNCGAEVPVDASFCEACGVKITPAAAPPPPPSAYPTPPPAAAPPAEKAGPPMKIIAIAVVVIVIVLGGVLFLASSATSGLTMSLQSGTVNTDYSLGVFGDITITMTLVIENPGFMSVEVTGSSISIKCRSSGREATFYSGALPGLRGTYSSTTTKTVVVKLSAGSWQGSSSIIDVWWYGCFLERPMQMSIEGTLDTKCLFMTGTSTVNVGWTSVMGY